MRNGGSKEFLSLLLSTTIIKFLMTLTSRIVGVLHLLSIKCLQGYLRSKTPFTYFLELESQDSTQELFCLIISPYLGVSRIEFQWKCDPCIFVDNLTQATSRQPSTYKVTHETRHFTLSPWTSVTRQSKIGSVRKLHIERKKCTMKHPECLSPVTGRWKEHPGQSPLHEQGRLS